MAFILQRATRLSSFTMGFRFFMGGITHLHRRAIRKFKAALTPPMAPRLLGRRDGVVVPLGSGGWRNYSGYRAELQGWRKQSKTGTTGGEEIRPSGKAIGLQSSQERSLKG